MSGSVFGKVAATLLVPMIALGAAAGLAVRDAVGVLEELEQTETALARLDSLHRAARTVGHERLVSALAALPDPPPETADDRSWEADTEAALARLERSEAVDRAVEAVAAARSTPVMRSANYGRATDALLEAAGEVEVVTSDAGLALGAETAKAIHDLIEVTDRAWIEFAERSSDQDRVVADLLDAMAVVRTVGDQVKDGAAGGAIEAIVDDAFAATAVMADLRLRATEDLLNPRDEVVTAHGALSTLADARDRWDSAAQQIELESGGRLDELGRDARARRDTAAVLGLFAVLAIAAAGMVLSGTLAGPVEDLAVDAEHFAEHRLDELAAALATAADAPADAPALTAGPGLERLVAAVNRTNDGLYRLAGVHARSRHHLARRTVTVLGKNTRLLQELVRLVASWRRADGSPEVRAWLFRIDHLATRMQRNAEALLLLAGGHGERHWSAPVSATDTARLALGEVGAFDRVDVENMGAVRVSGHAAPDVAHLLAELIENALNAADPRKGPTAQRVQVRGRWLSAGFAYLISDRARGIADEDRADINRRLHTPVLADDGPTEFLGLHIVAHLAQRHGIDVRLLESPDGGTVARVILPVDLIDPATIPADRKPIDAGRGTDATAPSGNGLASPVLNDPKESAARTFFGEAGGGERAAITDEEQPAGAGRSASPPRPLDRAARRVVTTPGS